jgi:hypothetical protein
MSDTIYTRALAQAVAAEGSSAALANRLHVPENTFSRWMSGRAQTPVKAFCKVIDLLLEHERTLAPVDVVGEPAAALESMHFAVGEIMAHCRSCDATEFALSNPATKLMYTSELRCLACDARVIHGELVARLARDAVLQSHATNAAREKRRALRFSAARRPPSAG